MNQFAEKIIAWYLKHKRNLPWRETKDPYKIWISEIILQQTRVNQGYEYYLRFIHRFPDVESLAIAEEDEVMKYWQGLGYYSRCRNLHQAAKDVTLTGAFPNTYEEVRNMKGVGDYTAAAICSFAYDMPYAVVDGNVYRVIARWMGIIEAIDTTAGKKLFAGLANELIDKRRPSLYNQAIMDFGALQCVPSSPCCEDCPLNNSCIALQNRTVNQLPIKRHRQKVTDRYQYYFYIKAGQYTYLHKRSADDIWRNLYEPPLIETESKQSEVQILASEEFKAIFGKCHTPLIRKVQEDIRHILSHRRIHATLFVLEMSEDSKPCGDFIKLHCEDLDEFPVSRLVSRFFSLILTPNTKH